MMKCLLIKIIGQINYPTYVPIISDFFKGISWPLTVLIIVFVFRKQIVRLIENIKSVEGFGTKFQITGENVAPEFSRYGDRTTSQPQGDRQAAAELAFLLSNYQFVWGAWVSGPEFCHAVRFSEKYSGGELRFVDNYIAELKSFQSKTGALLSEQIKPKLSELLSFIEGVLPYHREKELLSHPAFNLPKYQISLYY